LRAEADFNRLFAPAVPLRPLADLTFLMGI